MQVSNHPLGQRAAALQMGRQHPAPLRRRPQLPLHAQQDNARWDDVHAGGEFLRRVGVSDGRWVYRAENGYGGKDGEELGGV